MTNVLRKVDYSWLADDTAKKDVMRGILKTLQYLGLFSD